ncbi:hypothetical protein RSSM_04024 [Rhodopirellula sallentina SM41]|uniref:Uncharacterized protein n=1 Tax=Rhodopirellula sallentina SM41 TaxID=1263870 RepID=M5UEY0_9BACT|nr:hypothetical protein RSSM_04024 [Rhodopirellula sallentina SM41]
MKTAVVKRNRECRRYVVHLKTLVLSRYRGHELSSRNGQDASNQSS